MNIMTVKYLCFFIFSLFVQTIYGQNQNGIVKYKQTTYFDFQNMPGNAPNNMPSDLPKSVESFMKLTFSKVASIYEKDTDIKEDVNPNDNTPRMFRRMRERANRTIYKNTLNGTKLEQTNLFGKDFLVSDSITAIKWKVSAGEQKIILGYTCMKAIYKDSTSNLVVFFTPQIPVGAGPDKFGGLPGVILEVQSAQVHIIATEVTKGDFVFEPPSKGDKVTQEAFNKIREEKMKEQKEMWGGHGRGEVRIIRQ